MLANIVNLAWLADGELVARMAAPMEKSRRSGVPQTYGRISQAPAHVWEPRPLGSPIMEPKNA
jgi:hypothetical protein